MSGRIVVVSGTGTDVGKSVVTAAVAANAVGAGRRVAVVKPGQTGMAEGEPGDLALIATLVPEAVATHRLTLHEYVRYPEPLAPATAARRSGLPALGLDEAAERVSALAAENDLVVVEGAGGLLVQYRDDDGWTIADLAVRVDAPVVLVVLPALGTLHHTTSTVASAAACGADVLGLVIGAWPHEPGLAERCNVEDLQRIGPPLIGAVPEGSGALPPAEFTGVAAAGLGPSLDGAFDAADFTATQAPPPFGAPA